MVIFRCDFIKQFDLEEIIDFFFGDDDRLISNCLGFVRFNCINVVQVGRFGRDFFSE